MNPRRATANLLACLVLWPGLLRADAALADPLAEYRRLRSLPCSTLQQAELVSQTLDDLEADDPARAREFLALLAGAPGWRGTNGSKDVDRVWALAERAGFTDAQVVNVVRQAQGHLLDVLKAVDPARRLAELEALEGEVGGRSQLYDLYLGSSQAEQREQLAFAEMEDAEDVLILALQTDPRFESARNHLRAATERYRALLETIHAAELDAKLQADFLFRIAMLEVLRGDPAWRDTAAEIGSRLSDWRHHYANTQVALDQVYVERFLAFPPAALSSARQSNDATSSAILAGRHPAQPATVTEAQEVSSADASSPEQPSGPLQTLLKPLEEPAKATYGLVEGMVLDVVTGLGTAISGQEESCMATPTALAEPPMNAVQASLNPVHLARHLCGVATIGEQGGWEFSLAAFDNSMRRFENRDYRVVLLHYLELDDAPNAATLQQMLETELSAHAEIGPAVAAGVDMTCDVAALREPAQDDAGGLVRIAAEDAGAYLFVGGSLTYRQASALVSFLRDLEPEDIELEPYPVRPRVDR